MAAVRCCCACTPRYVKLIIELWCSCSDTPQLAADQVPELLSALPAWQMLDPLPVLSRARPGRGGAALDDAPADDVERLFEGDGPDQPSAPDALAADMPASTPPAGPPADLPRMPR